MVEPKGLYFFLQRPPHVPRSSYTVPNSTGFEINGSSSELAIEMALATGYLDFSTLYQIHDLGKLDLFLLFVKENGRKKQQKLFFSLEGGNGKFSFVSFSSSSYVYKRGEEYPEKN